MARDHPSHLCQRLAWDPALRETPLHHVLKVVRFPCSLRTHATIIPHLRNAAAKNSAAFTATTQARAQLTQMPPRRTTGWSPCSALSSTQLDTRSARSQRRGNVEMRNYLRDEAGSRSLVFDLAVTHQRFGSSSHPHQNGLRTHPQDIDAPLRT